MCIACDLLFGLQYCNAMSISVYAVPKPQFFFELEETKTKCMMTEKYILNIYC